MSKNDKMEGKKGNARKRDDNSPQWRRRSVLALISAGVGGMALGGRNRLFYKGKISGRKADHWEKIRD